MTELFWTKKAPTEDGWYWWREDISRHGAVLRVVDDRVYLAGCPFPLSDFGGEWYGPLVEPGGDAIENCQ